MNTDKIIGDALDIADFDQHEIEIIPRAEETDYEFARRNIRLIIEKGTDALNKMIDIADMSQHPRSYEVVSDMIKSLSETNKDLLELSEKKAKTELISNTQHQTINNNLYISTTELQKLLSKSNE